MESCKPVFCLQRAYVVNIFCDLLDHMWVKDYLNYQQGILEDPVLNTTREIPKVILFYSSQFHNLIKSYAKHAFNPILS